MVNCYAYTVFKFEVSIDKVDFKRVYNIMWVEFRGFSIQKIEWDISQLHIMDYMESEIIQVFLIHFKANQIAIYRKVK